MQCAATLNIINTGFRTFVGECLPLKPWLAAWAHAMRRHAKRREFRGSACSRMNVYQLSGLAQVSKEVLALTKRGVQRPMEGRLR
jgi:hypothetical protein